MLHGNATATLSASQNSQCHWPNNNNNGYFKVLFRQRAHLTDRAQYVSLSNHCSILAPVHSGVHQESVLDPMLLFMYVKPLCAIIDSHFITHHSFADD